MNLPSKRRAPTALLIAVVFLQACDAGKKAAGPFPISEFVPPSDAAEPSNHFSGRLSISSDTSRARFTLLTDELSLGGSEGVDTLPEMEIDLLQVGDRLEPIGSAFQHDRHPWWQYIVLPGRVWDEPGDDGQSRAALPFALKERNADCVHNGLLRFLFRDGGTISNVAFQITHQTCKYLQFDWHGLLPAEYETAEFELLDKPAAVPLPQRPLAKLADDYPGAEPANFGSKEEIEPETMTTWGFVIDGVHYTGPCNTPYGEYPYCDAMALPSYSTAKSFIAGLAVMRAEKLYPGISGELISKVVPACELDWNEVTVEHALDMATGHYNSVEEGADERAAIVSEFFLSEKHAIKVDRACNVYPRKEEPGQRWVYHTSDTYLVGAALSGLIRKEKGPDADYFDELLAEDLWPRLGLSELMYSTRRTYDDAAQPFTGWGITMLRDDVAKLLQFIGEMDGRIDGREVLDRRMFDAIKQKRADDRGLRADSERIRYNNGFRTYDVTEALGCNDDAYVTTMSGYGGINFVMMPNDTAYYYFSDGGVHRYLAAVRESHRIRPMCH
jgi:hypothetical protein